MTPRHDNDLVTVFGGSGFIGRLVVRALVKHGWRVRVACRRPDLALIPQAIGRVGQVHSVQANLRYPASIAPVLRNATAVVNLVGILAPRGRQTFDAVHSFGAGALAKEAAKAGITRFVHVSAIGADASSSSGYARTKGEAEALVRREVPSAVVMRPSVVFGPGDAFFNRFAAMARFLPVLPLIGADTRFQPVFGGDVAEAVAMALDGATPGSTFELGGPDIASLRDIVEFVLRETGRNRLLLPLSFTAGGWLAGATEIAALLTLGLFPANLTTTRDQVTLLRSDNVVSPQAEADGRTLQGLGIKPESFRAIAPTYLWRYRSAGQYDRQRLPAVDAALEAADLAPRAWTGSGRSGGAAAP